MIFVLLAAAYAFSYKHYPLNKDLFSCGLWDVERIEKNRRECETLDQETPDAEYTYPEAICENNQWKYDTCYISTIYTNSL